MKAATRADAPPRRDAALDGRAARAGEARPGVYEVLVERHSAMAYQVALRVTGHHQDAQDVTQEALIAAWEHLDGFREEASFSTWLHQIVTRRALNRATRRKDARSLELLPEVADSALEPAGKAERSLAADAVTDALRALPPPQRTAVILHHLEGLSYAQVAGLTGMSEGAVRSHLFRARRSLAKTLAEWR